MGWTAILRADLVTLSRSWLVRIWMLLLLMSFLMVPVGMLVTSRANPLPASTMLAAYLGVFLNVWGTVIIVLSAGSVSLEADIVADGILCRACTRTQYILAKMSARALVIGGVYLIGAVAAGYASWRYGLNDVTWTTMLTGIAIVGMALLMLVALGVTMSVIFNNTIVSVVGLLLLWYVAGYIFAFAGAEYMSPASLTRSLPQILRDSTAPEVRSASATTTSMSVRFSKEINQYPAEQVANYTVTDKDDAKHTAQAAVYNKQTNTVILSGLDLEPDQRVKLAVEGVTDLAGNVISPAANSVTSNRIRAVKKQEKAEASHSRRSWRHSRRHSRWRHESTAKTEPEKQTHESTTAPTKSSKSASQGRRVPPQVVRVTATETSASVAFSGDMDPVAIEKPANYTVESPTGSTHTPATVAYDPSTRTVLLSGLTFRKGDPVKVTVKDVADQDGRKIDDRRNSGLYREVHDWKYFVGFGVPALLAMVLGVVWFSRRDL